LHLNLVLPFPTVNSELLHLLTSSLGAERALFESNSHRLRLRVSSRPLITCQEHADVPNIHTNESI